MIDYCRGCDVPEWRDHKTGCPVQAAQAWVTRHPTGDTE